MRRLLVCGIVALVSALPGNSAMSASWTANSAISADARYVDNPRLIPDSDDRDVVEVLDVRSSVVRETPTSLFSIAPRLRGTRAVEDESLDRDEYFVDMRLANEAQRRKWSIDTNVTHDTTLTSEWGGTFFSEARKWRNYRSIYPSVSEAISERLTAGAGFGYSDVRYEDARLTPLAGYRYRWVDANLSRVQSDRSTLTFSSYLSRYDAAQFGVQSDDGGLRVSFRSELTPTLRGSADFGSHRTHSSNLAGSRWTTSGLFSARLDGTNERSSWSLSVGRVVDPSGFGVLVHRDTVSTVLNWQLSPRWSTNLAATVARDKAVQSQASSANRRRQNAEARVAWQVAPAWSLSSSALYSHYHYDVTDREAASASFLLRATYNSGDWFF